MRGLTFHGPRHVLCERVPEPRIEAPGDALLRVRVAGICGSDLHVWHGRERGLDAGTVLGHEMIGEVVEVGPAVRGLRTGTRVLSPFTTSCGRCFYCREGLTARCTEGQLFGWVQEGKGLHGGQAEYVRVPLAETTLVPIPEGLGDAEALLLGDVLPTGYYGAQRAGAAKDKIHVVIGCGPVGLMAILGARELGGETIFAVDRVPERLALAQRFGAAPLDASVGLRAAIDEATDGRGADAVIEAVGSPESTKLAFDLVRPGGTVASVGVHTTEHFPFSPVQAYDKNLTLRVGRCPARALVERLVPLAARRAGDLAAVISHRMPLAQGPEGYEMFDAKRDGCTKVALDCSASS